MPSSAATETANFALPTYSFSATAGPGGTISCGSVSCTGSYAPGNSITITATPTGSNTFSSWTGGVCSSNPTTNPCTLTMPASADTEAVVFNSACVLAITGNVLYTSPIGTTISYTMYGGGGGGGGGIDFPSSGWVYKGSVGSNGGYVSGSFGTSSSQVINVIVGGGGGGGGGQSYQYSDTAAGGGGGGAGYRGGGGGGAGIGAGGGGGGDSAILVNGALVANAVGGAGGQGCTWLAPGSGGSGGTGTSGTIGAGTDGGAGNYDTQGLAGIRSTGGAGGWNEQG